MLRATTKLTMVALAVMLMVNAGMAFTIPAHAIAKYRTWLSNSYIYFSKNTPFFGRSYGRVPVMPTFMVESVAAPVGGDALVDTVRFDRNIACPFITCNADTATITVSLFRDYGNNTPVGMASPSINADSAWFDLNGEAQGFIITMASADTTVQHYYIVGGYALPTPGIFGR